jgi:hypothetical protein
MVDRIVGRLEMKREIATLLRHLGGRLPGSAQAHARDDVADGTA